MFSLLLTILISAFSLLSLPSPALGTFGLLTPPGGAGGALDSEGRRYYGYGSDIQDPQLFRYYYGLTGVPPNLYAPMRPAPLNFPYYRNTAPVPVSYDSRPLIDSNSPTLKSVRSPQNVPVPYFPYSRTFPTGVPSYVLHRYYIEPFYESIETYTSYNMSKVEDFPNNTSSTLTDELNKQNNTLNESSEIGSGRSAQTAVDDESSKSGQDLQMTYLGYSPSRSSAYKQSGPLTVSVDGVSFYPVNVDSSVQSYQRSSSSSSPLIISPYSQRTTLPQEIVHIPQGNTAYSNYYNPNNFNSRRLIVSPYPSRSLPPTVWNQIRPNSAASLPYIGTRYRSSPDLGPVPIIDTVSSFKAPLQNSGYMAARSQNGYYLIDVQPVDMSRSGQFGYARANDPVLGLIPILPVLQPRAQLITTNKHIKTDEGKKFEKHQNQEFNTGFDAKTATGHIYSQLHTDQGSSSSDYHKKAGYTFSSGTGLNRFGSEGLAI